MFESAKTPEAQVMGDIFPAEAWELIWKNRDGVYPIILDVSTPREYEALHIEGAVNVNLLSRSFKVRLEAMDRNRTYLVYCKVGGRSKIAQKLMAKSGFRTVYNIVGGTLLWEEEGLPFASGTDGVNKLSFCPIFISIVMIRKLKKLFKAGRQWMNNAALMVRRMGGKAKRASVKYIALRTSNWSKFRWKGSL